MLPRRGLSASAPASALRNVWPGRTQAPRPLLVARRFSSQARHPPSTPSRVAIPPYTPVRGAQLRRPTVFGSSSPIVVSASGILALRAGSSRDLSLWPFSSKKQPPAEPQSDSPPYSSASSSSVPEGESLTDPAGPAEVWQDSFANTSSTTTAGLESAAPAPPAVPPPNPTSAVDLSTTAYSKSFTDLDLRSILDIPEQIGYLKTLGLEWGYGPTSSCEWLVEHLYIYSGMPWWATIATLCIAWRAAFFVPTLAGSRHQALLQQLYKSPEFMNLKREYDHVAVRTRDPVLVMQVQDKMTRLKNRSGARVSMTLIGLLTIPFSIGMFRLLRAMAAVPVPSLETGGLAWFTDLTVHDPYYILPVSSIALTSLMFKYTRAANPPLTSSADNVSKLMMYGLPPVVFMGTAWLPAGVQWFFFLLSAGSVAQTWATLNPAIRRWAGIPPLPLRPTESIISSASFSGPEWQAPTSRTEPKKSSLASRIGDMTNDVLGNTREKEEWQKAQDYEKRRAAEEKEKAFRRLEERRRRRDEKKAQ
ncbi:60Kd inner membrane protein-domain-containing protein [Durotheca rogersii]|uniref:60Kd inner membrane protein-domain-containing protein n=1 Tax=Durotheca rogersii TaxID=419775 RepID=UPI00221FE128|nr:60Kd inner membrane protein-domain-containing protein [Durotheca rogersii]KAI5857488.1 60Kd inner membrane protein-domain-containing protein [Durotheca rogersii]